MIWPAPLLRFEVEPKPDSCMVWRPNAIANPSNVRATNVAGFFKTPQLESSPALTQAHPRKMMFNTNWIS